MIKRRLLQKYTIGNKKLKPAELHGEQFYNWFDNEFGLKQTSIHTESAGVTFITRHPNMPTTSVRTTIFGAGHFSASSPPIRKIIDSGASLFFEKEKLHTTTPTPLASGTTLHQIITITAEMP